MENHTTVMKMGILEIVSSSSCIPRALSSVLNVNIVLEEELVLEYLGDYVNAFIVLFWIIVCTHPREQQELKGIVYPKMKILSYLPSCRFKFVRPLFIFRKQIKIFLIKCTYDRIFTSK